MIVLEVGVPSSKKLHKCRGRTIVKGKMSEAQPYIIFSLNNVRYGLVAICVEEIFSLPELKPVVEAPLDIVGVMNLRGEIIPVMDLNLRFGYRSQSYSLTDCMIVLRWKDVRLGAIVNQVHDVANITKETISKHIYYGIESRETSFVAGIVQVEADIVMLLNHETLIQYSEAIGPRSEEENQSDFLKQKSLQIFSPEATAAEREIFQARAENLKHQIEGEDLTGLMPVAVIGLNEEYFGLDLGVVREFTEITQVTPIPCCPPHIVGNMNLRGEIVTLVDIRSVLNLTGNNGTKASKAMIVQIDDLVAGVTVDRVFDVIYLSQIKPVPSAVHSPQEEYLRGTAMYGENMMSILDLPKIIIQGGLIVDEEIA